MDFTSLNISYQIEETESKDKSQKYLLIVKDKPFYVGELVYLILDKISQKKPGDKIVSELNEWARGHHQFTLPQLIGIVESKIRPLGVFDVEENKESDQGKTAPMAGIQGQWTLLKFQSFEWVLKGLKYLFEPWLFVPVFIGMAAANIHLMNGLNTQYEAVQQMQASMAVPGVAEAASTGCGRGYIYLFLFYPVAFTILLLHELGHAAASYRYKVNPKNIGFGFYILFPVLYTDITGIWKLNRFKRTIINLGGIYFQLFINLGLIWWVKNTADFEMIKIIRFLMILNITSLFINFNPFFKFDGYWIYSDLFNLPNLRVQSNAYLIKLINWISPQVPLRVNPRVESIINLKNPLLLVYSLLKYAFYVYFFSAAFSFVYRAAGDLTTVYQNAAAGDFSVCALEFAIKTLFVIGIFGLFVYKYSKVSAGYVKATIRARKQQLAA